MDQRTYVRKFNVVLDFDNALPTQSLNCISRLLCTYVTLLVLKMYFMYLRTGGCLQFLFAKLSVETEHVPIHLFFSFFQFKICKGKENGNVFSKT